MHRLISGSIVFCLFFITTYTFFSMTRVSGLVYAHHDFSFSLMFKKILSPFPLNTLTTLEMLYKFRFKGRSFTVLSHVERSCVCFKKKPCIEANFLSFFFCFSFWHFIMFHEFLCPCMVFYKYMLKQVFFFI